VRGLPLGGRGSIAEIPAPFLRSVGGEIGEIDRQRQHPDCAEAVNEANGRWRFAVTPIVSEKEPEPADE